MDNCSYDSAEDMFSDSFQNNIQINKLSLGLQGQDDSDAYYCPVIGEYMKNGRYEVKEMLGRGVFGSVVRAIDTETKSSVAIKIMRLNLQSSGKSEATFLQKISESSLVGKKYILVTLDKFHHNNHLCLVLELLLSNLRELLKQCGNNVGLSLHAVKRYAKQLLLALQVLQQKKIIHCDIKPDNILISHDHSSIRLCDFGTAVDAEYGTPIDPTPYLASRFYRAPELILGIAPFTSAIDIWSLGCTLYELFTGTILFQGECNNDMLAWMMLYRGNFPPKLLKKSLLAHEHFAETDHWAFLHQIRDTVTHERTIRTEHPPATPVRSIQKTLISSAKLEPNADLDLVGKFADFLNQVLILNPDHRLSIYDALNHPFVN